jgi:hypothetical protein
MSRHRLDPWSLIFGALVLVGAWAAISERWADGFGSQLSTTLAWAAIAVGAVVVVSLAVPRRRRPETVAETVDVPVLEPIPDPKSGQQSST